MPIFHLVAFERNQRNIVCNGPEQFLNSLLRLSLVVLGDPKLRDVHPERAEHLPCSQAGRYF